MDDEEKNKFMSILILIDFNLVDYVRKSYFSTFSALS